MGHRSSGNKSRDALPHDGFNRSDHALVVIGGHPPDRRVLGHLPLTQNVVCADSGLDHALRLGLTPSAVVGDMDSVDASNLNAVRLKGCAIVEHPADKDLTDTELAIAHAVTSGCRRLTVVWGGGDRIDHVLGVIASLGHPSLADLDSLTAWVAVDRVDVVHAGRELVVDQPCDTTISLIPIGSSDAVVTTRGLKWNLQNVHLPAHSAKGVSNVVIDRPCSIASVSGVIAVVVPGTLDDVRRVSDENSESAGARNSSGGRHAR